jgi:hypothetical protein
MQRSSAVAMEPHGEGEESKKLPLASVSTKIGSVSVNARTPVSGQIISTFSLQACSNLQQPLFIRKGASLTCTVAMEKTMR